MNRGPQGVFKGVPAFSRPPAVPASDPSIAPSSARCASISSSYRMQTSRQSRRERRLNLGSTGHSFNTLRGLEVNVRIVCFGGGDIHRTVYNRAGALLSLEAQRKTPGVATRMRREGVLTDFIVIHLWIR
jgi:hypothetical protein